MMRLHDKTNFILFLGLALIASGLFIQLAWLPFLLFGIVYGLLQNVQFEPPPLGEVLSFLILPCTLFLILFSIILRAPTIKIFFLATFFALFIGNYFVFPLETILNVGPSALLFGLLYLILVSVALTISWKGLIITSDKHWQNATLIILALDVLMLIGYFPFFSFMKSPLSLEAYIAIGNFLDKAIGHNIFYLDYGGYVIIATNIINAVCIAATAYYVEKNKK